MSSSNKNYNSHKYEFAAVIIGASSDDLGVTQILLADVTRSSYANIEASNSLSVALTRAILALYVREEFTNGDQSSSDRASDMYMLVVLKLPRSTLSKAWYDGNPFNYRYSLLGNILPDILERVIALLISSNLILGSRSTISTERQAQYMLLANTSASLGNDLEHSLTTLLNIIHRRNVPTIGFTSKLLVQHTSRCFFISRCQRLSRGPGVTEEIGTVGSRLYDQDSDVERCHLGS